MTHTKIEKWINSLNLLPLLEMPFSLWQCCIGWDQEFIRFHRKKNNDFHLKPKPKSLSIQTNVRFSTLSSHSWQILTNLDFGDQFELMKKKLLLTATVSFNCRTSISLLSYSSELSFVFCQLNLDKKSDQRNYFGYKGY